MSQEQSILQIDVTSLRSEKETLCILRSFEEPLLVLGSMQPAELVRPNCPTRVLRRRGGGGAVYLEPRNALWFDIWLPTSSSFHQSDVREQLRVAGEGFRVALEACGLDCLVVADPTGPFEIESVCFAGIGVGELLDRNGRKLVGITAWRSKEGSLLQCALYRDSRTSWLHLLHLDEAETSRVGAVVEAQVASLSDFGIHDLQEEDLLRALASSFGGVGVARQVETL